LPLIGRVPAGEDADRNSVQALDRIPVRVDRFPERQDMS
jgi:hypothetical protein